MRKMHEGKGCTVLLRGRGGGKLGIREERGAVGIWDGRCGKSMRTGNEGKVVEKTGEGKDAAARR